MIIYLLNINSCVKLYGRGYQCFRVKKKGIIVESWFPEMIRELRLKWPNCDVILTHAGRKKVGFPTEICKEPMALIQVGHTEKWKLFLLLIIVNIYWGLTRYQAPTVSRLSHWPSKYPLPRKWKLNGVKSLSGDAQPVVSGKKTRLELYRKLQIEQSVR